MAGYDFQKAKSEMDFMFKGLKQEIEGNKIYGVKVPLKYSLLITRGKNSLVFRLPESGLVGKSSFYDTIAKEKDSNHKGYFMFAGYASGLMTCGLEMTIESFRSESGLVGKSSFYDTIAKEKDSNHKGYFMFAGYASGLMTCGLEMTIESLKD